MPSSSRRWLSLALGGAIAGGCLTSFPELREGDGGADAGSDVLVESGGPCGASGKLCGQACVPTDDPAYGCASAFCNPCSFDHGVAKCSAGACALSGCVPGFDDCDGNPENGCEVDLASAPDHCGRCDRSCGGAECAGGRCGRITLADTQRNPWSIEVDATHAYWTNASGTVGLLRVALAGSDAGATVQSLYDDNAAEGDVALDDTHVYWADREQGLVLRMHKQALGTPEQVGSGTGAAGVALDESHVYWTSVGSESAPDGTLSRRLKSGGATTVLAQNLASPWMIALDATYVYWTSLRAGTVHRLPKAGGAAPTPLAASEGTPAGIAAWGLVLHADQLYWRESDAIRRVPAASGAAATLLSGRPNARFIALFGDQLAWTAHSASIKRVETATVSELANQAITDAVETPGIAPHGVAIDETWIYWTDWGSSTQTYDGVIYKVARP